jgi:hypothetical protein
VFVRSSFSVGSWFLLSRDSPALDFVSVDAQASNVAMIFTKDEHGDSYSVHPSTGSMEPDNAP